MYTLYLVFSCNGDLELSGTKVSAKAISSGCVCRLKFPHSGCTHLLEHTHWQQLSPQYFYHCHSVYIYIYTYYPRQLSCLYMFCCTFVSILCNNGPLHWNLAKHQDLQVWFVASQFTCLWHFKSVDRYEGVHGYQQRTEMFMILKSTKPTTPLKK
jgi:hypothetical protein